jgi:CTP synthase (UTP-ammonia lyase)
MSSSTVRIALVGDYSLQVQAHVAIPRAIVLACDEGDTVECVWIATTELAQNVDSRLSDFQGIWCVPGSPYASMNGALNAIHFARERRIPFLGTCGGFQHALIEYARSVLGQSEADHAESNPSATFAIIQPLACALRETEACIQLKPESLVRKIYGKDRIVEAFNCSFGLAPQHTAIFSNTKLKITGQDVAGAARVMEVADHPFFVATLFQPERSALNKARHPLITAFVRAVLRS